MARKAKSAKGLWSWFDYEDDFGRYNSHSTYNSLSDEEYELEREKRLQAYQADKQRERANRMVSVISTYASVLAFQPVRCYLASGGVGNQAPAWSDGGSIGFSLESLPDLTTANGALVVKGLAIHEIGHILFTARIGTPLRDYVIENDLTIAYNILEDCRLEALMIGRFGKTIASWLSGVMGNYITNGTEQELSQAWPLIAGRHYLDTELRLAIRNIYHNQNAALRIEELASEYRTMLIKSSDDFDRVIEIITEFDTYLPKGKGVDPNGTECEWTIPVECPFGHNKRPINENNGGCIFPVTNRDKDRAKNRAEQATSNLPAPATPSGQEQQVLDADEITSRDAGMGSDETFTLDPVLVQSIRNQGKKTLEASETNLAKELSADLSNYSGKAELEQQQIKDLPKASYKLETPSELAIKGSKAFKLQLQRLKNDYLPEWVRRTPSGKLNAGRYLTGCDLDEAFDKFDEGNDEVASIEAVILLDKSGSMGNEISDAYEAMWAIKRALDEIGASTSVITFSSSSEVLYSANERATTEMRTFGCGGGTDPEKAIMAARNIFAVTKRPVKLFLAITDGEWSAGWQHDSSELADKTIKELRNSGVLTSLVTIRMRPKNIHNCELTANIQNSAEIFALAKDLVSVAIQRNLGHH